MIIHLISLSGYKPSISKLVLGTEGSYGNEVIRIQRQPPWDNLAITAYFIRNGKTPVTVLVAPPDDLIAVPSEATETPGADGRIVLEGLADDRRVYSVDIAFSVLPHSAAPGEPPDPPTPDAWDQIRMIADTAARVADSVRQDADGGRFNGPPGPEGPPGKVDEGTVKTAVEEYLEHHPVQAPVQSVNGKTGVVTLNADDVGAIAQSQLQQATNNALVQAKASGMFDGAPGRDGRDGKDGIDGAPGRDGRDGIDGAPGRDGDTGPEGPPGPAGSDAMVTDQNIASALGYTPASESKVSQLKEDLAQLDAGAVNAKKAQTFSNAEKIQARSNAGIHVLNQAEYDSIADHGSDLYIIVEE